MDLRSELLKSIWYGFTALDLEKSGKVSKSQLKVSGGSSNLKMGEGNKVIFLCEVRIDRHCDVASFPTRVHFQPVKVCQFYR